MTAETVELATDVVLDVFLVNGLLLAGGDVIAAEEGLTSARWQVLGAVALSEAPVPVPRIARRMGLSRQSVQVSVNRLVDDGMLAPEPNDGHRRSPLFGLTDRGRRAYERLTADQRAWMHDLAADLSHADLQATSRVLRAFADRLGAGASPSDPSHRRSEGAR